MDLYSELGDSCILINEMHVFILYLRRNIIHGVTSTSDVYI